MKDLLISWTVGLVMVLIGGFFAYTPLKDVIEHAKRYKEDKAEKTLRWWYLEWLFILGEALLGTLGGPNVFISLMFIVVGTLIFVVYTIRIVASFF